MLKKVKGFFLLLFIACLFLPYAGIIGNGQVDF